MSACAWIRNSRDEKQQSLLMLISKSSQVLLMTGKIIPNFNTLSDVLSSGPLIAVH
jgi:hypothetical protein